MVQHHRDVSRIGAFVLATALAFIALACGGSHRKREPVAAGAARPGVGYPPAQGILNEGTVRVFAHAEPEDTLLRVDVRGHAARIPPNTTFERPAAWRVEAWSADSELKRLVLSPGQVARDEVDMRVWDVTVTFSVYFQPPDLPENVLILIFAPGLSEPHRFVWAPPPPAQGASR